MLFIEKNYFLVALTKHVMMKNVLNNFQKLLKKSKKYEQFS